MEKQLFSGLEECVTDAGAWDSCLTSSDLTVGVISLLFYCLYFWITVPTQTASKLVAKEGAFVLESSSRNPDIFLAAAHSSVL